MSIHISATAGQIGKTVFLPGDPLRARWAAETYLTDPELVTLTRNMLGFTGFIGDTKVTVMGSGMGMPSVGIYFNELVEEYGVRQLVRIGSCGALRADVDLGDVIIPLSACHDSNMPNLYFDPRVTYAPSPDPELLYQAWSNAVLADFACHRGSVYSTDTFYTEGHSVGSLPIWQQLANFGCVAVEMESAILFTLGARLGVQTLSILTVSDNLVTGQKMPPEQREKGLALMVEFALRLV